MKTIAHHVVARERKVAAPRGPKAVWLPAPPNAPAKSAAEPLCSMMTMISTKQTRMCSVTRTNDSRQPIAINPTATSSDRPHFAQDGPFQTPKFSEIHDSRKRLRIQTRTTYQRAVYLGLRHQAFDVVRLDAATVQNSNRRRLLRRKNVWQQVPGDNGERLRQFRGWPSCPCRLPKPARKLKEYARSRCGVNAARPASNCCLSTAFVKFPSRSAKLSPRHTMGVR